MFWSSGGSRVFWSFKTSYMCEKVRGGYFEIKQAVPEIVGDLT